MFHSCILMIILKSLVFFHPFYISMTEIRYNVENEQLEISQRIFWDDLESALSTSTGTKINFLHPSDPVQFNATLKEYLLTANSISVNGQQTHLEYLGFEIEEDAAWFYFETEKIPLPEKVSITISLLFDHFEEQQNVVNFYLNQEPKSLLLSKGKSSGILEF